MSGKRISIDQVRRMMSAFADAIPDDLNSELAQEWANELDIIMPDILRCRPYDVLTALDTIRLTTNHAQSVAKIATYPADGVPFDLAIEPFPGIDLVGRFGCDNQQEWKFNGREILEPQTKKFMLVSIGYQPNWEAVKTALLKYGAIPEGQWCDAFKKAFPQPDGKGLVGVADASWVSPRGSALFPYIHADGVPHFDWAGLDFGAGWRFLVLAQAV